MSGDIKLEPGQDDGSAAQREPLDSEHRANEMPDSELGWTLAGTEPVPRILSLEGRRRGALVLLGGLTALYPLDCYRPWSGGPEVDWADFVLRGLDWGAMVLYVVAFVGLALRCFWARVLTVYFFCQLILAWLLRWPVRGQLWSGAGEVLEFAALVAVMVLLSGKPMRQLFDDRPSRWNFWAGSEARLERVRGLILVQVGLLNLFYGFDLAPPAARGLAVLLGMVCVVGLAGQQRWALTASFGVTSLAGLLLVRTGALAFAGKLRADLSGWEFLVAAMLAVASFVLAAWSRPVAGLLLPRIPSSETASTAAIARATRGRASGPDTPRR